MACADPRVGAYVESAAPKVYRGKTFANIGAYQEHGAMRIWNGCEAAATGKDGRTTTRASKKRPAAATPPLRAV